MSNASKNKQKRFGGDKAHSCKMCDYKSGNVGHLKQHMLIHTGEKLFIDGMSISGTLPTELGLNSHLSFLWGSGSGLSGTIPASIGTMTSLHEMSLLGNHLNGTIPDSIGNMTGLDDLAGRGTSVGQSSANQLEV